MDLLIIHAWSLKNKESCNRLAKKTVSQKTVLHFFYILFFFIGPMIRIGREIQCFPYAGTFSGEPGLATNSVLHCVQIIADTAGTNGHSDSCMMSRKMQTDKLVKPYPTTVPLQCHSNTVPDYCKTLLLQYYSTIVLQYYSTSVIQ